MDMGMKYIYMPSHMPLHMAELQINIAICTDKDGLRLVTFSAKYVGQVISYCYISGKLEHIYPEKQQNDSEKDNGSKHMEGVMQEGMLDKIGIAYCMSLPNTPILWTTSVTNCRILPQEICFRGSQYHRCSLLVSGWRHTVSLTFTYGFCKTIWNLVKSLKVMLTAGQAWQTTGPHISI